MDRRVETLRGPMHRGEDLLPLSLALLLLYILHIYGEGGGWDDAHLLALF